MQDLPSKSASEATLGIAVFGNSCSSFHQKNKPSRIPLNSRTNVECSRSQASKSSLPSLQDITQENCTKLEPKQKAMPVKVRRIEKEISKAFYEVVKKQPNSENLDIFKKEIYSGLAPLPAFHGRRLISVPNENERAPSISSLNGIPMPVVKKEKEVKEEKEEEPEDANALLRRLFTHPLIVNSGDQSKNRLMTDPRHERGSSASYPKKGGHVLRRSETMQQSKVTFKNYSLFFEERFQKLDFPQENVDFQQAKVNKVALGRDKTPERIIRTRQSVRSRSRMGTEGNEERGSISRTQSRVITEMEAKSLLGNFVKGNNIEKRTNTEGDNAVYLRSKSTGNMVRLRAGEKKQGVSLNDLNGGRVEEKKVIQFTQNRRSEMVCELPDTSIMDISHQNDVDYLRQIGE